MLVRFYMIDHLGCQENKENWMLKADDLSQEVCDVIFFAIRRQDAPSQRRILRRAIGHVTATYQVSR